MIHFGGDMLDTVIYMTSRQHLGKSARGAVITPDPSPAVSAEMCCHWKSIC